MKVILTRGLPGSGKSTWAKQMVSSTGCKRVSKDDLRSLLDNSKFTKGNENMVLAVRDAIILESVRRGIDIIVDDTNFEEKHFNHIKELVSEYPKAQVEINDVFCDVPLEQCIKNDLKRPNSVGSKVITDMYNKYLKKSVTPIFWKDGLTPAIIVDIDGTVAHMHNRIPYDYSKVKDDLLDTRISTIVGALKDKGFKIIFLSGRPDSCRFDTEQWLYDMGFREYEALHMRNEGDRRKDFEVKKEIFEEYIRPYFNILAVFDDRDQVVDMWRSIGLKCLQVQEGNF